MKKSLRNLVVTVIMAATVITASATAFAGQYVQTDMNFRSGASNTSASIGDVPAGAEVDVLGSTNAWNWSATTERPDTSTAEIWEAHS